MSDTPVQNNNDELSLEAESTKYDNDWIQASVQETKEGQWSVSARSITLMEELRVDMAVVKGDLSEMKGMLQWIGTRKDIKPIEKHTQEFTHHVHEGVQTMEERIVNLEEKINDMDEKVKKIDRILEKGQQRSSSPHGHLPQNADITRAFIRGLKLFVEEQIKEGRQRSGSDVKNKPTRKRDSGVPESPLVGFTDSEDFIFPGPYSPGDQPPSASSTPAGARHPSISENGSPSMRKSPKTPVDFVRQRSLSINRPAMYNGIDSFLQSFQKFLEYFESEHEI